MPDPPRNPASVALVTGAARGPVALVTGAARGIGRAVARELARGGFRVHAAWRSSAERAAELEVEFEGRVHRADLADPAQALRLVGEVLEASGRIDCVVHAVGDFHRAPLEETGPEALRRVFESNLATAHHLVCASRPALRRASGAYVFFGTAGLEGARARRSSAAYSAAKTALLVYVRSLAREEAAHGVRANMVSPGLVPHAGADPDTRRPDAAERVPLGRTGTPEEVARVARWLCSAEAAHVTGVNLDVAGGWML